MLAIETLKYEQFNKMFWTKLAVGDYIKVKENTDKAPHVFAGCIESKYPDYIVIKGKRYRECFNKNAFYCKDMLIVDYLSLGKANNRIGDAIL